MFERHRRPSSSTHPMDRFQRASPFDEGPGEQSSLGGFQGEALTLLPGIAARREAGDDQANDRRCGR
jgi:hypothetical protein